MDEPATGLDVMDRDDYSSDGDAPGSGGYGETEYNPSGSGVGDDTALVDEWVAR
ncbi:hypothetical protein LX16_3170 [Stackebrandtia albiflava]|uniref:Uncharacterized protein n=1 Tax=Stackebrandtia albiflava TaxID=406432 RepID=A0A562V3H7_9ACTN|nr:hypothetical protein [Stackebrandtia albiflava]TWJ12413.1 hypothetical protein LX16_3170 [Stackebrandtia albiflava]